MGQMQWIFEDSTKLISAIFLFVRQNTAGNSRWE